MPGKRKKNPLKRKERSLLRLLFLQDYKVEHAEQYQPGYSGNDKKKDTTYHRCSVPYRQDSVNGAEKKEKPSEKRESSWEIR